MKIKVKGITIDSNKMKSITYRELEKKAIVHMYDTENIVIEDIEEKQLHVLVAALNSNRG